MKLPELKTLALQNLTAQQTALGGLLDTLPEPMRAELNALKLALEEQCAALNSLEESPSADSSTALDWCARCIEQSMKHGATLMEQLGACRRELETQTAALFTLQTQVASGELVPKATVEAAVQAAQVTEQNAARTQIAAARQHGLELASLPSPSPDILTLAQPEFAARQAQTAANLAALAQRGLKPGGKGAAFVVAHAWDTAAEFAGAMELIADLAPPAGAEPLLPGNPPAPAAACKRLHGPI